MDKLEKWLLSYVVRRVVLSVVNKSWRGDLWQLRDACPSEHRAGGHMDGWPGPEDETGFVSKRYYLTKEYILPNVQVGVCRMNNENMK